jgi:trehalose 6-phosphate synthase
MGDADLVLASNRGPVSFKRGPDGELVASRGAGGLVSSVAPLVEGTGATWVAAAMSDEDREAAEGGLIEAEGFRVRSLDFDPDLYHLAYDVVSNGILWFLHHGLFDLPRRPRFDRLFREAWEAYRAYNRTFAEAVAEAAPNGGVALLQDYHLSLAPALLAKARPDLRIVHFSHTPFAPPSMLRVLPDDVRAELLAGMGAARACGFHATRWAANFEASCPNTPTFVSPLAPDVRDIQEVASSDECRTEHRWLDEVVGESRMILRVDRIELSKNILRGFLAFDDLLEHRPSWRGHVVFVALVYPSREALPEYQAYRVEVQALAERVNQRWGTDDWTPVVLDDSDNFPRSVAALSRYDVLLVNPICDGLNLVAKEGPLVNANDGVLALSREAGAWDELGQPGAALGLNPYDVVETAEVLHTALSLDGEERAARSRAVREAASARSPEVWLDDQRRAAGSAESRRP